MEIEKDEDKFLSDKARVEKKKVKEELNQKIKQIKLLQNER